MSNDGAGRDELIGRTKTEILLALTDPENEYKPAGEVLNPILERLADALSRQSAQVAEAVAYRYRLHDQPLGYGWSYATTLQDDEYEYRLDQDPCIECLEPLYASASETVPRSELEQYRKDAERWRTIAGLLLWSPQFDDEVKWSMQIKMPEPDMYNPKAALTEAIDRAGKEAK
jgi:hypothetical protein